MSAQVLYPPGALDKERFTALCVRCGNCINICPSQIIFPNSDFAQVYGLPTPALRFESGYCLENCNRCTQVCPSGAITSLSVTDKNRIKIGIAKINLEICLLADGKECTTCIKRCPYDAIVIKSSDDGFSTQPWINETRCNGCGACEFFCPTRPKRAIKISTLSEIKTLRNHISKTSSKAGAELLVRS
jgi:ferredoxin-type protein NapF